MYQNVNIPEVTMQFGKKQVVVQPSYSIGVSTGLARDKDEKILVNVTHTEADRLSKADGCILMRVNEWRELTSNGYRAMAFDDNFGRNSESLAVYEWLAEVLKRPKGRKEKYVKNENGREFNLYTVFVDGKPTIDLWLPDEGVVRAWYDNGFPAETAGSNEHGEGSEIHYSPDYDLKEIVLYAGVHWGCGHDKCFRLHAYVEPSCSRNDLGFRKVRE